MADMAETPRTGALSHTADLDGTDIDRFLRTLWHAKGTDVLLTVGAPPVVRVDGIVRPIGDEPVNDEARLNDFVSQLLDDAQRTRLAKERELDFAFSWAGMARIRGNAFFQREMPTLALRMIPDRIPSFDEIGLPQSVRNTATLAQGLVLFTGPTGSGKSTSLAALIEWINVNRPCHIVTIEDPIEYVHQHRMSIVSQREVGTDTHSFERALRAALREDPDVVLVGEMRDPESIAITLTLAETGHLVFSTLHTNDAAQALDRVVDVFPSERQSQIRLQLSGVLTAVVAQRLIPKIGGGLTSAFEVMMGTSAIRNLVREGKTRQIRNVITTSKGDGMQTLEAGLSQLVQAGVISYEDAVTRAVVPNEVERSGGTAPVFRR